MTKFKIFLLISISTFFIQSCEDSDNIITVSILDFTTTINEKPNTGSSIGVVSASTNQGSIAFSIIEQTPLQAIQINEITGEITVLTRSLFNFQTYSTLTAIVKATNSEISDTATITINLLEVIDDYNLLAVSDQGEVLEVGNNTGDIVSVGQINKENSASFLSTGALVPIENNIYSIEYLYNPAPTNNLLIYNKQNNTTQIIPLSLPSGINGSERKIISLARDENNIIGVLTENIFFNNSTNHLISIDLQDFSITELGITFNEGFITSMIKINSKLYLSTWADGFLEVDLLTNTVNNSSSIKGSRMARINDSELAIMQQVSGYINGGKPEKINLTNQTVTSNFNEEPYGLITVFGTSIYENQQYFNLVSSLTLGLQFGILKSNFETSENLFVEIGPMDMNRNLIILGIEN